MNPFAQSGGSRPTARLVCVAVGVLILALSAARAGEDPSLKFRMRVEPAKTTVPLNLINLRPNAPTTVGIFLENPSDKDLANVAVKLVHVVDDKVRVLAETMADLPANKETRIQFVKGKDTPEKLDFSGPPFQLQLWHSAGPKKGKEAGIVKLKLDVSVKAPRDFVEVTLAEYNKKTQRLRMKVKLRDTLVGKSECPVQLVLGSEIKETKKGVFKQVLTDLDKAVELFADDVELAAGVDSLEAPIFLNVDGFERAFTYTLKSSGELVELLLNNRVGVRLQAPQYAAPTDKLPIVMELDGPLDADYRVEIGLDRAGKKEQFQRQNFTTIRAQKVQLTFSPLGDLIWLGEVKQWQTQLDVADVFGSIWLRIRVFDRDKEVELFRSQGAGPSHALMQTDAEDPKSLFARVVLDPTPPQDIEFVDLPKQFGLGKPLPVLVKVRHQAIDKVFLLRGKAPADGKLNPDAIIAVGDFLSAKGEWLMVLPAQAKAEPLEVSVFVTAQTGKHATKSATISFKDAATLTKTLATIKGKVTHGPLPQPKLDVTLFDAKGNVKGNTKSDGKGEFVFEQVPPGEYVVTSRVAFPALVGREKVSVPEGKEQIAVTVKLLAK